MNFYDEDFFQSRALPPVYCLWDWCVPLQLDESRFSLLCKDNISCNKVYIFKTLVFCIYILTVCMIT
jgi:hypothetical protein